MQTFTQKLLTWFADHGRHNLPWQNTRDAYRIWVSEIMLQQTQVTTVIPYYQRFIARFPDVSSLAKAGTDEVLHHWTGLGYYARARNLHKTAQAVCEQHSGQFPTNFDDMLALPGIGRSTAGAILAFSADQHHAILDGNVKRVLARFYAIEGWYGQKVVENTLWEHAEANTPSKQIANYTQAIMDLGAIVCTRSKPNCLICPIQTNCQARIQQRADELPHRKPKKDKPVRSTIMLLIKNQRGEFLLNQNPPTGIWGSLWCPPQISQLDEAKAVTIKEELPTIRHTFSHYHLDIQPMLCQPEESTENVEDSTSVWYKPGSQIALGLAAPVKKLLEQYA